MKVANVDPQTAGNNRWNARVYRDAFNYVTKYGDSMIELLDAQSDERILDLGCGTGEHVSEIAASGAQVVGIDVSDDMLALARQSPPNCTFAQVDVVQDSPTLGCFDAVFSNAALHWLQPQERALAFARGCLGPSGRFVAEMGGDGNIEQITGIFRSTLDAYGLDHLIIDQN